MPASRSRTTEWRRSLEQLRAREGAIEVAVAHDHPGGDEAILGASDLVWRVRVLDLSESEVAIDLPFALGRAIELPVGTEIVGAIAIGQNRWMFRCKVKGAWNARAPFPRTHRGVRLTLPDHVERCLRRSTRVDVAQMNPPKVEMWPLLEPRSAMPAELTITQPFNEPSSQAVIFAASSCSTTPPMNSTKFTSRASAMPKPPVCRSVTWVFMSV